MSSWIFQGNPDKSDVEGYLRAVAVARWTVRQERFAAQMRVGDRVFFWRAGAGTPDQAGVLAAGRIESDPADLPNDEAAVPFEKTEEFRGIELRVDVRIDRVADARGLIKRAWLQDDPVLFNLRILRFYSETNYLLSDRHAERLELLWGNTGRAWSEDESLAGLWAYAKTRGGTVSERPGSPVSDVAVLIGRAVTGVYSKVMNFRALDPSDRRGGRSGVGAADRAVWARYFDAERGLDVERVNADYAQAWLDGSVPSVKRGVVRELEPGSASSQGYESNPLVRRKIERHAVTAAIEYYRAAGYDVEDVGNVEAFDLVCKRSGQAHVRVEVKGTRGKGKAILLTEGEVANARNTNGYRVDLFILSDVRVEILADGTVTTSEGNAYRIEDWKPSDEHLTPTHYRYQVP